MLILILLFFSMNEISKMLKKLFHYMVFQHLFGHIMFHTRIIFVKFLSTQTRKIKEVHLIELIPKKIFSQSSPLLKFEDFDLFFAFIEKVSTSTNNRKIFISIENKSFHFQQFCDIKFNSQKQSSDLWFKDPGSFILNSFDYKTLKITLNINNSIETDNPFIPRDLLFKDRSGQCNYQADFTTIAQKSAKKVYSKDYHVHTKQLINENKQRRKSETNVFDLFAKESDDCFLFNNGEPKFSSRITIDTKS